ncbi:MAG: Adaptive-response sensory-kinase SasA [Rhodocyclaceae bacterium]|nr:Adaptive-response sensory-kinase SasA [Rhodocyclaceae bacterium]
MEADFGTAASNEGEAFKKRFIRIAGLIIGAACLIYLVAAPWAAGGRPIYLSAPSIILLACLAALSLLRRVSARTAGIVLVYGLCAGALTAGALHGTVQTATIYSLVIVVGLAGWLAGPRHAVAVAALSAVSALGIALAVEAGLLQPAPLPRPFVTWIALALILTIAAIFSRIVSRAFQDQLARVGGLTGVLQEQLRESRANEAQLRLITENMPAMLLHNREHRCVYANARYAAFVGKTQKALVGLHVREQVGAAAYAEIAPYVDRADTGERVDYRRVVRRPDGTESAIEVSLVPERDDGGKVIGQFVLARDITPQVQSEKALRLSENKFSKVFRANPLAIAITRLSDGQFLDVNEAWCRLHGWTREEALGRTSVELGTWTDPRQRESWRQAMLEHGHTGNLELRFRTKDGKSIDVLISAELIELEGKMCALVMATDLTERKRTEEALRQSEARFATLFRSNPEAIMLTTPEQGRILDVNDAFERVSGWARDEVVGRSSVELGFWAEPRDRARWLEIIRAQGFVRDFESMFVPKSGRPHPVQLSSTILDLAGERVILNFFLDITERKRIEEALRASQARLLEAQRIGHVGSWDLDLQTRRMIWSDELHRIYERTPEEFDGSWDALLALVHPDDLPVIRQGFRESAQTRAPYELDHRILTPSGRLKHLHVRWEVFFDEAGQPLRALGTAQDATEQVQAREQIERLNADLERRVQERTAELTAANRELESFAYSISHDLRAPLRGIDGFSQLLADEYRERLDAQGVDYLERVRRAAQRMGHLIDDILELSRVTRQEMRRVRVDLSQIAAELIEELARAAPAHRVETHLAPGLTAQGDPQLLRVLMQNLVENAWKYSAKETAPRIEFGQERHDEETVFFVRDNGVGFDMQFAGRLFTPFQRLHRPEEFEGTGIGLATVARIAHRHGGRAWIESEPGKGTTVRFTLSNPGVP